MSKLSGESLNITEQNIAKLQQLFPEAFTEGKIDFDVLKQLLGDFVDDDEERYRFKWNGKGRALRLSQTPSLGTLRPCKEESKDWDTTQNLYIEGDNLEVLKLLQKSYYGKVKMIYIDPPYNTGGDFVYKDDFRDNIENYKRVTGQVDDEGCPVSSNTESNGRFHTDWLNMMYPRLRLARNLLSEDGIIFISIGDEELDNLRKICHEVFGESNFRNQITIRRGAKSLQAQFDTWDKLGQGLEYILMYTKQSNYRFPKQIKLLDEVKEGSWNNHWRGTNRPTMRYELFGITPQNGQWRWSKERSYKAIENYQKMLVEIGYDKSCKAEDVSHQEIDEWYSKQTEEFDLLRLSSTGKPEHYVAPTNEALLNNSWVDLLVGSSNEISQLFKAKVFDTPKLTTTIKRMLGFVNNDSLILDFFSGSATTAHAVMQLNAEDGGHRKFIMVQIPERTDKEKEAYKSGYATIAEIGKERIRRAGEKILAEMAQTSHPEEGLLIERERERERELAHSARGLDVGFKVFKLDSSNLRKWNPQPEDLQIALQESVENFLPGRKELDVVYEILLKKGYEITVPIAERDAAGKQVYVIGDGSLMVCLGNNITVAVADEIVKLHREYGTKDWSVVFQDNGFASDMDKTNIKETLKTAGLDESCFECL